MDIINTYFNMSFLSIETFLFFSLIIRLIFTKIKNKKVFTTAGICYLVSIFVFLLYSAFGLYTLFYGDYFGCFSPAKTFLFITALVYLQIYFYKISKGFKLKNSEIAIKNYRSHIKSKNNLYIFSEILFVIETLCVPIFSNSKCYIRLYEIVPAICLTIFLIYQLNLLPKIRNFQIILPWTFYTVFMIIFLIIRFLIENFGFCNLNFTGVLFRIFQIFSLGYISFIRNDDLEACLE